jgi:hypothetical protein
VIAVGLALAVRPVLADDDTALALARRDVESSDYLAARSALVAALNAGSSSPKELAEIWKLTGIVEGALDDEKAATAAFEKWLALDPDGKLPDGTSPKITRPLDAAAARMKKRAPLKVKTETSSDPPSVTVVVVSDPDRMVTRARVHVRADGGKEAVLEGAGKGRITIALPHGKRLDLQVEALDAHGNRVVELGTTDVPIVITSEKPKGGGDVKPPPDHRIVEPVPAQESRPVYLSPYVWGGVAIVFAGVGSYFGYEARVNANRLDDLNKTSQQHMFSDATALESTTRTDVLLFNIGMIGGGALAIGTVVLYMTQPETAEKRVGVVPTHGGGAIVFGGRF